MFIKKNSNVLYLEHKLLLKVTPKFSRLFFVSLATSYVDSYQCQHDFHTSLFIGEKIRKIQKTFFFIIILYKQWINSEWNIFISIAFSSENVFDCLFINTYTHSKHQTDTLYLIIVWASRALKSLTLAHLLLSIFEDVGDTLLINNLLSHALLVYSLIYTIFL